MSDSLPIRAVRKLVFTTVTVVSILLALELVLRAATVGQVPAVREFFDMDFEDPRHVKDPVLFWKLRPGVSERVTDHGPAHDWIVNPQGFRQRRPTPLRKAPGSVRVFCIGDSVTFGWLVDQDLSYPARLQELLSSRQRKYEVINAGVPGYSSHQGLAYLEQVILDYSPDVLITYLGINDSNFAVMTDRDRAPFVKADLLLESLSIYKAIRMVIAGSARERNPSSIDERHLPVLRCYLDEFIENMERIGRICDDRGIALVLVQPIAFGESGLEYVAMEARRPEDTPSLHQRQAELFKRYRSVDLMSALVPHEPQETALLLDSCHFNAKGNRIVAETLLRGLGEIGLLTRQ